MNRQFEKRQRALVLLIVGLMFLNLYAEFNNTTINNGLYASPEELTYIAPEKVDLGCSVLWGNFNLGAKDETRRGGFFGWGDPTGEKISQLDSYGNAVLTPPVDLTTSHQDLDIVHVKLGDKWHTPTSAQMLELIDKCNWTHVQNYKGVNGLDGYEVRGKGEYEKNSIFIPHSGCRTGVDNNGNVIMSSNTNEAYYWSSELTDNPWGYGVFVKLQAGTSKSEVAHTFYGMHIRPVYGEGSGIPDTPDTPDTPDPDDEDHSLEVADTINGMIVPVDGVDLGLSVKWAGWNVGATDTTMVNNKAMGVVGQYGGYYSWGETSTKDRYTSADYTLDLTERILAPEHDAATMNWGSDWRMPTEDEWEELVVNCTATWETATWKTADGQEHYTRGYRYTSKVPGYTDRSIFLPAGGVDSGTGPFGMNEYGYYWSSSKHLTIKGSAVCLLFSSDGVYNDPSITYERFGGLLIRPVMPKSSTPVEPYAVLSENNTVLTFYYDKKKEQSNGMDIGPFQSSSNLRWNGHVEDIKRVVFDSSFGTYTKLSSTKNWFRECKALTDITGIEYLHTDKVTDMSAMFNACSGLTSLDVSCFKTYNVTDMEEMFSGCSNLTTIYVGEGWDTANITEGKDMFKGCAKLVGGAGTTYDANHVDYSYAHIDRGSTNPGYLTLIDYSDWQILKQLYNELNGDKWKRRWNTAEAPSSLDDYPGVTIKGGRVVEIDLPNNNIEGVFPCQSLSLPYLKKLNISDNSFYGDIGAAMSQFGQQNTSLSFSIQELSITNNKFTGNIGVFASPLSQLNHLDASNNCIEDVIPMISPNVTNLNLSRQETNRVVDVTLSDTTKSWITQVPTVLTYNHKQQSYGAITDASIYCSMKDGEWGFFVLGKVPSFPERNEYYGESGDTLRVVVLDDISAMQGGSFFIKLKFDNGDSNFDGYVNILDLQTTINYMFQDYDYLFNYNAANLWKDDVINVQDIICLVNLLLMNSDNTGQNVSSRRTGTLDNAKVYVQDAQLILDTNMPVAAFDIFVSGVNNMDVERTLELSGMTVSMKPQYDGIHIIGYSLNGTCIPVGISVIGTFDKTASVRNAILSDKEAHAISVSFDANITGINTIESSNHNNMNIYDLQGRKVNSITNKGIYIENGHKIVK